MWTLSAMGSDQFGVEIILKSLVTPVVSIGSENGGEGSYRQCPPNICETFPKLSCDETFPLFRRKFNF